MKIRPMWSASLSCCRLNGSSTPTCVPAPNAVSHRLRVASGLFFVASASATPPSCTASCCVIRSLPCRAIACATSCPITTAMPASSLQIGRIPV